jgi:hypothetical protein
MADGATITISDAVWQKKIAEYAARTGLNMREALYEEWPLLIRKVMDFTPPFETGGKAGATDLSVGRGAVASDIYKTMNVFNPAARTRSLEKVIDEKNIEAFNIIARRSKSGYMKGKTAVAFSPQIHLSQRNKRGRVGGSDRRQVVLGSDVGLLKKYVAEVQNRVGWAKSGWLKALLLVGGTAPNYVMKKGTSGGDVIDDHADEENPSITAINRTPWAVRKDEGDRILSSAKASRIQAIISKIRVKERLAARAAKLAA